MGWLFSVAKFPTPTLASGAAQSFSLVPRTEALLASHGVDVVSVARTQSRRLNGPLVSAFAYCGVFLMSFASWRWADGL